MLKFDTRVRIRTNLDKRLSCAKTTILLSGSLRIRAVIVPVSVTSRETANDKGLRDSSIMGGDHESGIYEARTPR
jgi:hypothetical protein